MRSFWHKSKPNLPGRPDFQWPEYLVRFAPLLAAALLGGCASSHWFPTPAQEVSQALEKQQYARAVAIIDRTDESSPQHDKLQQRRAAIVEASQAYRLKAEARARVLAEDNHWEQAYRILTQARHRVVDPDSVISLLNKLHQSEHRQLRGLLTTWYLAQGEALLNTQGLEKKLKTHTGQTARQLHEQRQHLYHDATRELTRLGNEYADQGLWKAARDTLTMAQKLNPDAAPVPALEQAHEALRRARNHAENARHQARREQAQRLIRHYQSSGRLEDLLAARTFLAQHPGANPGKQLHQQVIEWCRQRFQAEVRHGDALYARGRYKAAYRTWKQALPLNPHNAELKKKMARARKVLESIRTLTDPE